ncbi:unnamed protein product [Urochloa decumbens]|uniref:Uncharacterized protein n=1 Tax=Urochloa decumbens TaxID=240449 RepID=A0ABC8Y566_9POAL
MARTGALEPIDRSGPGEVRPKQDWPPRRQSVDEIERRRGRAALAADSRAHVVGEEEARAFSFLDEVATFSQNQGLHYCSGEQGQRTRQRNCRRDRCSDQFPFLFPFPLQTSFQLLFLCSPICFQEQRLNKV